MKKFSLLLFLFGIAAICRAELHLEPNDLIAICGDSITEQRLYSVFMEDYFLMCQPAAGLRTVQAGWSGDWAGGFAARMETDLFPFKPTVATISFGMNDGRYRAMETPTADAYRANQTKIVEAFKKNGVRTIVLGSPGCVDSFSYRDGVEKAVIYNKTLTELAAIDREIAEKEGVLFADVNAAMNDVMAKAKAALGEKYPVAGGDGVHPDANGHVAIAYAYLKALGCDGAIGTITADMAGGKAEGTAGQKIVSVQDGTIEIESSRYPFCFVPATSEILRFIPFNADLNRYLLVVHGLKTGKAKVTWGTENREFSAAELERGVNLAEVFLNNPFSAAFAKVDAAVQAQQANETILVKSFLHYVPDIKKLAPNDGKAVDDIAANAMARDRELMQAAAALVVPVRHSIKIEGVP